MDMTLAEFLLARIAEDEAAAGGVDRAAVLRGIDHPRPIKECRVKRWIVELHQQAPTASTWEVLRLLGTLYVKHPDYREEWQP